MHVTGSSSTARARPGWRRAQRFCPYARGFTRRKAAFRSRMARRWTLTQMIMKPGIGCSAQLTSCWDESKGRTAVAEETRSADESTPVATDERVLARARLNYAIVIVVGIFVFFLGLGILTLMAVPLVHAIAGKHTDFSLTVSFSLTAVFTATTALSAGGAAIQTHRVKHHKNRARDLENRLKEAQARAAELEKRHDGD
jgi:hypothetical protein